MRTNAAERKENRRKSNTNETEMKKWDMKWNIAKLEHTRELYIFTAEKGGTPRNLDSRATRQRNRNIAHIHTYIHTQTNTEL